jgi:hypothetical protein
MVRSIEIPEPLLEFDVTPRWDREENVDEFHCVVLVGGQFVVYERTLRKEPDTMDVDGAKDEFLGEFAERIKALLAG